MVRTLIFIFLFTGLAVRLRAQDLENMDANSSRHVLQPALSQSLDKPIKVVGPLHLRRQTGISGIVAISINCYGDSSGTGPVIGGGRGDQVITYIDGIPVRGGSAEALLYAEKKWLPGIPAEYGYREPERWTW